MTAPAHPGYFDRDVCDLSRALIGATLPVRGMGGMIVGTEACGHDDSASHSLQAVNTHRSLSPFGAEV